GGVERPEKFRNCVDKTVPANHAAVNFPPDDVPVQRIRRRRNRAVAEKQGQDVRGDRGVHREVWIVDEVVPGFRGVARVIVSPGNLNESPPAESRAVAEPGVPEVRAPFVKVEEVLRPAALLDRPKIPRLDSDRRNRRDCRHVGVDSRAVERRLEERPIRADVLKRAVGLEECGNRLGWKREIHGLWWKYRRTTSKIA